MKQTIRALIECFLILTAVFLIIHRHVFSACLTGSPMPEPNGIRSAAVNAAESARSKKRIPDTGRDSQQRNMR